jgi:hypothetical protein
MFKIDIEKLTDNKEFMDMLLKDIVEQMSESIDERIEEAVMSVINDGVKEKIDLCVKNRIEEIVEVGLDQEFEEVDKWGKSEGKFTIRKRLVEKFKKEANFLPKKWDSDESVFTRMLKKVLSDNLDIFGKEFDKVIDTKFIADCQEYAAEKLRKRLGIKK